MFTSSSERTVQVLDELLGSRRATQQLLALASAAVLTAFPYDHRAGYLAGIREQAPRIKKLSFVSNREVPEVSTTLRDAALQLLLNALEHDLGGDREAILERLKEASTLALADATDALDEWDRLVFDSHERFVQRRLTVHDDLN
jgi:hypothetical protein